jgi:hypothetical protein
MARAADVEVTIDDFQKVADRTPYIADLKYDFSFRKSDFLFDILSGHLGNITWKTCTILEEFQLY